VTLVEMCSHLATERAGMGTLHLTVGASEFYPNGTKAKAGHSQGGPGADPRSFPEGRVSIVRWNPKGMRRSSGPQSRGAIPTMNRSAKEGARSSRHYGDEGATHPPLGPRCVRTARSGRARRDPRRSHQMLGAQGARSEGAPISRHGEGAAAV
jgi:ribosomal protein L32